MSTTPTAAHTHRFKPVKGSVLPDPLPISALLEPREELVVPLVELLVPELDPELELDDDEVDADPEDPLELPELCEPDPEELEPLSGSTYCWSPAETPEPWASAAAGTGSASTPITTMQIRA
jgi:hypothetical protein